MRARRVQRGKARAHEFTEPRSLAFVFVACVGCARLAVVVRVAVHHGCGASGDGTASLAVCTSHAIREPLVISESHAVRESRDVREPGHGG